MDDIEVPNYFICPISLEIMKDPVIVATGITYDRESIEHWIFEDKNITCPVTKQPLSIDSELTPNHTLRRLIQAWCTQNSSFGIDRIPTPKVPLDKVHFLSLIRNLWRPNMQLKTLRKLELLATEQEKNRKIMVEAGVIEGMVALIAKCYTNAEKEGLKEAINILFMVRNTSTQSKEILGKKDEVIDSLMWILRQDFDDGTPTKNQALLVLKTVIGKASTSVLERLRVDFFRKIVCILKEGISQQGVNAALQIMLDTCPWGRNRFMMIENGAIFEVIELNLGLTERKTTELSLCILFHLCSSAEGRSKFIAHGAAIDILTKDLLTTSPCADDRVMLIISVICKFSGSNSLFKEMLSVGLVAKLCTVLQVDCAAHVKDKAKEILRAYSHVWTKSPCLDVGTLFKYCK